jgi:hypothetical protein
MDTIVFQHTPTVTFLTNIFINVPIILKHEDTNLIEIVNEIGIGFTTQIPIYHSDGTYLAKVTGNRIYPTDNGKKAGLIVDKQHGVWVCKMGTRNLFEISQQTGDSFKLQAELYTPNGYFIKCHDQAKPDLLDQTGRPLVIGGVTMRGNTFKNVKVGIWTKQDGQMLIGVNQ